GRPDPPALPSSATWGWATCPPRSRLSGAKRTSRSGARPTARESFAPRSIRPRSRKPDSSTPRRATMSNVPADLKYTREHEWAKVEGDRARIGITAFAQEQLGDVVFVELPKVGARVSAMKGFGVVESVKAVSDLFAPLTGEVVEVNGELTKKPETVNTDPYGQGWMIVIKLADAKELDTLLSAADYQSLIASAGH